MPGRNERDTFTVISREKAKTPDEANQYAAVAALYQLAGDRQYNRILPEEYRELWARHVGDREELEEMRRRKKKQREEEERRKKKRAREPQPLFLGEDKRRIIEEALAAARGGRLLGRHGDAPADGGGASAPGGRERVVAKLKTMGFGDADIDQACPPGGGGSIESALDWLVMNLPEDRLPSKFTSKKGHSIDVIVSGRGAAAGEDDEDGEAAREEEADPLDACPEELRTGALWLAGCGHAARAAVSAMRAAGEARAALALLNGELAAEAGVRMDGGRGGAVEGDDTWAEELDVMASIYDDRFAVAGADRLACSVTVRGDDLGNDLAKAFVGGDALHLEFVAPRPASAYPDALPCIGVRTSGEPGPLLRSAAGLLLRRADKHRGEAMLHSLTADLGQAIADAIEAGEREEREAAAAAASAGRWDTAGASAPAEGEPTGQQRAAPGARRGGGQRRQPRRNREFERRESERLYDWQQELRASPKHNAMRTTRRLLPAAAKRDDILEVINANSVVVLTGQTGCGKSTQVPQFIFEDEIERRAGGEANIICTQPRRVAALGLAERVAAERGERAGESVGYSVRLESKQSARTRLLFCTTGILLRRLISDGGELAGVTHIILDEVHERSVESDLLLLLLRDIQRTRNRTIRLVLMSATADADTFVGYFGGPRRCGTIFIPGFTHPVREFFLEDALELTGFRIGKGSKYAKKASSSSGKAAPRAAPAVVGGRAPPTDAKAVDHGGGEAAPSVDSEGKAQGPDSWDDDDDDDGDGDGGGAEEGDTTSTSAATTLAGGGDLDAWDAEEEEEDEDEEDGAGVRRAGADGGRFSAGERRPGDTWMSREDAKDWLSSYSDATQRSIDAVDESIINYVLIEYLLCYILTTEASEGSGAMVGKRSNPDARGGGGGARENDGGGILVFLPGAPEINSLMRVLRNSSQLESCTEETLIILPLHGSLSAQEQGKVFQRVPRGSRLIVLATNVAETSVTIDGVVYVIDAGRHKETTYDSAKGLTSLQEKWVSAAAATQRRGRAGRTRPGACFRLFSRLAAAEMSAQQEPEVLRISLEQLALRTKAIVAGEPIAATLSKMPTPPSAAAVDAAVAALTMLQALDAGENLTPLGQHLAHMPVDARVGKMLLLGVMLRCLDPILSIAAALAGRSPFIYPSDPSERSFADERRQTLAGASRSDHIAMAAAYKVWSQVKERRGREAARNFAIESFLSDKSMETIEMSRQDYASVLSDLGFIPHAYCRAASGRRRGVQDADVEATEGVNALSQDGRIVKAVLSAGFYPNVVNIVKPENKYVQIEGGAFAKDPNAKEIRYFCRTVGRVFLHPTSVNFSAGKFESPWLLWTERVETSKIFLRQSSMISPYAILLFGGQLQVEHEAGLISLDGTWSFKAPARIGILIRELRDEVRGLLAEKLENPAMQISSSPIVDALLTLLSSDGF